MKLQINDKTVLELTDTRKKVIKNDIPSEVFEDDVLRRCKYWLESPCEKYASKYQDKIKKSLQEKGVASIPVNLLQLAKKKAEEFPCPCGYDDIKDKTCAVGDKSFVFSSDHQKVFRKMCEKDQEDKSTEEYIVQENKSYEDRMAWIIQHKYERCLARLKLEWLPKLEARGIAEIPSDDDAFAELVFAQTDYKDRSTRDLESKEK